MKTSEALKYAKTRLWDGGAGTEEEAEAQLRTGTLHTDRVQYGFICNAAGPYINLVGKAVQRFMPDHFCLEDWLLDRGYRAAGNRKKVQATRLAWLDYMINIYELEGD